MIPTQWKRKKECRDVAGKRKQELRVAQHKFIVSEMPIDLVLILILKTIKSVSSKDVLWKINTSQVNIMFRVFRHQHQPGHKLDKHTIRQHQVEVHLPRVTQDLVLSNVRVDHILIVVHLQHQHLLLARLQEVFLHLLEVQEVMIQM